MSSRVGDKRKRGGSAQQRAYWANRRFSSLQPWSEYGAIRSKRGTPESLSVFGSDWKSATMSQRADRKATGFTGRGKYKFGKGLVKFAKKQHLGQKALDMGMQAAQQYAGRGLYGRTRRYTGRGTYNQNVTIEGGHPAMTVNSISMDNQEVTISHHEYLQDVFCPNTSKFENQSIALNPAIAENLPWLSQIAANYEEYEFIQCVFEYRSTIDPSASNNSTGATGTLIMATNYNPDAPEFQTKEAMMQYHGACSGRLTDGLIHGVECDPTKNAGTAAKYTRSFALTNNESKKDFDLGKFQFAVINAPSAFFQQQIGELWCTYTVRLQKPRLNVAIYRNLPIDRTISQTNGDGGLGVAINQTFDDTLQYCEVGEGEQNSTGIVLEVTDSYTDDGTGTGTIVPGNPGQPLAARSPMNGANFLLRFPDFLTGSYEITISYVAMNDNSGFAATDITQKGYTQYGAAPLPAGYLESGNVKMLSMLGPNAILVPNQQQNGGPWMTGLTIVADAPLNEQKSFCTMTCVIQCSPATTGVDNTFQWNAYGQYCGAGIRAGQLTIKPINDTLSDRFKFSNGLSLVLPKEQDTLWPGLTGNGF
jgi:hypothetical protein